MLRQPVRFSVGRSTKMELFVAAFWSICSNIADLSMEPNSWTSKTRILSLIVWLTLVYWELGHNPLQFQVPGKHLFSWFIYIGKTWIEMLSSILARWEQRYYFELSQQSGFLYFTSLNKSNISFWKFSALFFLSFSFFS